MFVLSRQLKESIILAGRAGGCLVTVVGLRSEAVSLQLTGGPTADGVPFDVRTVTLVRSQTTRAAAIGEIVVVDIRGDVARLGVVALKDVAVHRLEVWEALRRENRPGDADDGPAGSPVPRPGGPPPPGLNVRLDEPKNNDA